MKYYLFLFLLCFVITFSFAQNKGRIKVVPDKPKAGVSNQYIYEPPNNLVIPEQIEALILYENKQKYYNIYVPISKVSNFYQFSFTTPDSTSVLIIGIVNAKRDLRDYDGLMIPQKKIIDNNGNKGFVFYLCDKNGKHFYSEKLDLADLLYNKSHRLEIKVSDDALLGMYKGAYKANPQLKSNDSYLNYLEVLYSKGGDIVKPQLVKYANKLLQGKSDEARLAEAYNIYKLLKVDLEMSKIAVRILQDFPRGQFAKEMFWKEFYKNDGQTVKSILISSEEYVNRFNDSTIHSKERFYLEIISVLFKENKWDSLLYYENLVSNKSLTTFVLNQFAWKLSGKKINNEGTDLEIAKVFSKKGLDYCESQIKMGVPDIEQNYILRADYNRYINTYALILYKMGRFDSAFYYQDLVFQQDKALSIEGLERYAVYAEKEKGPIYGKKIIEEQFLNGANSATLFQQLQAIYKELKLPENQFDIIKERADVIAKKKNAEVIKAKYGTIKAIDFLLKNLKGQEVSLSSLANKVVVLDFWASWCIPCRSSFPEMQKLVNKYKDDDKVVFLFIDVWEKTTLKKMKERATEIMNEGNYNFNVLLDEKNKVVMEYKINAIPVKFIIDNKGNIVFIGETADVALEIDKARQQN